MSAELFDANGLSPKLLQEVEEHAFALRDEMRDIQHKMHVHPELAFKEQTAHDLCTDYMSSKGWSVTRHAYGLETAWQAVSEVGKDGPVIGFNSEMDALPGIGQACGHNLICLAGIAAAIATAKVLKSHDISGKVVLLGTPAEEAYGGKCYLLKRDAYKDMVACLMAHPWSRGSGVEVSAMTCILSLSITYTGKSAHAGLAPQKGVNALDAAVSAYSSIGLLRQQIPPSHRIACIIQGSEDFYTNIIPPKASLKIAIRSPSAQETLDAAERVLNCLKAGALASGCDYEIRGEQMYMDIAQSKEMGEYLRQTVPDTWKADEYEVTNGEMLGASSDFGNVSYHMPALHPMFHLPELPEDDSPHSQTYAQSTNSDSALDAALRCSTHIAAVGVRIVIDREWANKVRRDWEEHMRATGGFAARKKIENFFGSFPLAKVVDDAVNPQK